MSERKQYHVKTVSWERGLILSVGDIGVTQTHVDYPEQTPEILARDLVAIVLSVPEGSFDLVFDEE